MQTKGINGTKGPKGPKGPEVFAYVGLPRNLKDLKDLNLVDAHTHD